MPTTTQAKAIAAVKFGSRKLQTDSALAGFNKAGNDEKHLKFFAAFTASSSTQTLVKAINDKLAAFFSAIGDGDLVTALAADLKFTFQGPDEYSIPKRVWSGKIPFPYGAALTVAQYNTAETARKNYSRACGDFRHALAQAWAIYGVMNDVANLPDLPNEGGVVVGKKHTPQNQA